MQQIAEEKTTAPHQQQQDDQNVDAAPGPFFTDPAQFAQRIDPNKHALSKPCCVGEFSLDRTRRQQLGRSRVRYFNEQTIGCKLRGANLGENFHTFVPKVAGDEGIEQLLQWIMLMAPPNSSLRKTVHECDFVLWRGTMTRLSTSPYDTANMFDVGVKVACTKHKGVYFVNEYDTEAKRSAENNRGDQQRRMCYAGFKFEQLVTVEKLATAGAHCAKSVPTPVDQSNEFVGIFKATLMNSSSNDAGLTDGTGPCRHASPPLRLLYGAEIDCISPVQGEFMEIKTQYKAIGHGKGFVNKALKWWVQSYLIGIKQLVVGTHDHLVLNRVELFPVASLPQMGASSWSGPVCLEFLFHFLHCIRRCLDALPDGTILVAERLPRGREFKFCAIGADDASGQSAQRVLNEAFKNYPWY